MPKPDKTGRKEDGRWRPGISGNPSGRPRGSRHKATLAAEALLDGQVQTLTEKAIEVALTGDVTALRLVLDRVIPPRRDRPVSLDLSQLASAADATKALAEILNAVSSGELTPEEGQRLAAIVEGYRKTLETEDLERRIAALEGHIGG